MTFDQLYYFSVVADILNFTKAAEMLYISQPTLSRQIVMLERELNAPLFNREYKEISLTEAGTLLRSECDKLLVQYAQIKKSIQNCLAGNAGALRIMCLDFYYKELFDAIRSYTEKYPEVLIQMAAGNNMMFTAELIPGKCDAAIGWDFDLPEKTDELEILPIYRDRFVAVFPESHCFAAREKVSIAEIRAQRVLFLSRHTGDGFTKIFNGTGLDNASEWGFYALNSVDSLFLQLKMSHRAVALVPLSIAKEKGSGCAYCEIEDWDSGFNAVLAWRKANSSNALRRFVEIMQGVYAQGPHET